MEGVPFDARAVTPSILGWPAAAAPTWTRWHEIGRVICYPPYLKKTLRLAFVVGSVLFALNHLDEVMRGHATLGVWVKGAVTYLIPFCVSNFGVLVATRRES